MKIRKIIEPAFHIYFLGAEPALHEQMAGMSYPQLDQKPGIRLLRSCLKPPAK
jgi:hypothetical protein